ncbi:hypothetical protein KJ992_00585 [Patescibacteria group bacterium]|nr:hypothetical protein [Patescibacteria group bacterium]
MEQNIQIIKGKINNKTLRSFLGKPFDDMVKFVVDIEKKIVALGGELHVDAEQILLESESKQQNLWGGNIYPDQNNKTQLEYESLINIRPSQNNRSMEIQDEELKNQIKNIIEKLIEV